ncbi:hypothetical protein [Idiomarina sp.]|uniref:hypothetical protein n=1 Tax=Idiomarina sp. TaxID=1874361 RepID=UPI002614348B|nr:hypothetical protein [Idiomarina sp.]
MRFLNFGSVELAGSFSELQDSRLDLIARIENFKSSFGDRFRFFEALVHNENSTLHLLVQGLLSDGLAFCVGSYFKDFNYLLFREKKGGECYFAIQHNNGIEGFYFPKRNLWIGSNFLFSKYKGIVSDKDFLNKLHYLSKIKSLSEPAKLVGFIEGASRPYHYFYDRLPSLHLLKKKYPYIPVYTLHSNFYIETDLFTRTVVTPNTINELDEAQGFLLQTFRFKKTNGADVAYSNFQVLTSGDGFAKRVDSIESDLRGKSVIWVGLCEEKRQWQGKIEEVKALIKYCLEQLKSPVFIFDGMTCPTAANTKIFTENNCRKEVSVLKNILNDFRRIEYFDLIGKKAREKAELSLFVDLFFTSALTDSVWPSLFGGAKGIVYSIQGADSHMHYHPLSFSLDHNYIYDIDNKDIAVSERGYQIESLPLRKKFKNMIEYVREVSDLTAIPFEKNCKVIKRLGNRVVIDIDANEDKDIPVYGCPLPIQVEAFNEGIESKYEFKASAWHFPDLKISFLFEILSSDKKKVLTSYVLDADETKVVSLPVGASFYLVTLKARGSGELIYNGICGNPP